MTDKPHRPTGIEEYYIIKDNKKLRFGYTTGTCAAAAAKAAAQMLLSQKAVEEVPLLTPKGILLHLPVLEAKFSEQEASCAVRKDAGDDPDVTDGILVYAHVRICPETENGSPADQGSRVKIDGGTGVGRITRSGMQRAPGEAAINPVPMRMIREAVEDVMESLSWSGCLEVVISIPEGAVIAKKTFNPRLGIEGGISVLGTSGIVVPMSESALLSSIRLEMEMLVKSGHAYLLVTPGNYGETFAKEVLSADLSSAMKCSNFVGEALDMAVNLDVKGILFVANLGKFIKVAGGIMNTHSRCADSRAELMCAFALRAGADLETAKKLLDTETTDAGLEILEEAGLRTQAMELAVQKISYYLQHRCGGRLQTEAILFSSKFGYLAQTQGAQALLQIINGQGL